MHERSQGFRLAMPKRMIVIRRHERKAQDQHIHKRCQQIQHGIGNRGEHTHRTGLPPSDTFRDNQNQRRDNGKIGRFFDLRGIFYSRH